MFLKGPKTPGGYVSISENVQFENNVTFASARPWATTYYVDASSGDDGDSGKNPDEAFETVQAAVDAAGVGDVIYINPQTYVVGTGHARYDENVEILLAKSDLSIIGAGYSRDNEFGVRMKSSSAGYCFEVYAPSCHIENIGLFVDGGTGGFHFENDGGTETKRGGDGAVLYNVHSKDGSAKMGGGQAWRMLNCVFFHATGSLVIADPGASSYHAQMRNCVFVDNNGAQPTGPYISGGGGHCYSLVIDRCHFMRVPSANSGAYVMLSGSSNTGMMTGCYFEDDAITFATHVIANGTEFRCIGCYDEDGLIAT